MTAPARLAEVGEKRRREAIKRRKLARHAPERDKQAEADLSAINSSEESKWP